MVDELFSLEGKTIVLTGATGFIGSEFVRTLGDRGAHLILLGRDRERLEQAAKNSSSRSVEVGDIDMYDIESYRKLLTEIARVHRRIDGLVNNAFDFSQATGFNHPSGKFENYSFGQFSNTVMSGIYWALLSSQILGKAMQAQGRGSIVNICTMYATVVPSPDLYEGTETVNPPGYSMAKAGLLQLTKYCAAYLAPNVRVNALSPGAIPNTIKSAVNAIEEESSVLKRLRERTPLKRTGVPADLVGGLVYLLSDASKFMTGQNLIIDGGFTIH